MNNYIWISLAALFVIGCSSSNNTTTMTDANSNVAEPSENIELLLVDRDWELTSFASTDGIEQTHSNEDGFSFALRFTKLDDLDGNVIRSIRGAIVCNDFDASYTLENSILNTSRMLTTAADCEGNRDVPLSLFQRILFNDEGGAMLTVRSNVLEVVSGSNEKLVFTENNGF